MAYYTGTASSFGDFKAALESAAITAGWTDYSGVLGKGGAFVRLEDTTDNGYDVLNLAGATGQSAGSLTGDVSNTVRIMDNATLNISWPATYHIHAFDDVDEIYGILVVNVEYYLSIKFGVGGENGIAGHAGWVSGVWGTTVRPDIQPGRHNMRFDISTSVASIGRGASANISHGAAAPALWASLPASTGNGGASYIYADVEGAPVWRETSRDASYIASILTALPSPFNEAHVLLPIKCLMARPDGGVTILKQHKHARIMRIDNVSPEEIITYGGDQWKCYPFYRKNTTERNGAPSTAGGQHSGTFGMAVRYDGS